MGDTRPGERTVFFLVLGAVVGAGAALLMAPESGKRTRRRLIRKGDAAADYLVETGRDVVQKCEELCERSGELMGDATHVLSNKYRALRNHSKELRDEAEAILRYVSNAARAR
jgi:gas vesicle protein